MRMTRITLSVCAVALCAFAACSHGTAASSGRTVRTVEISDHVKPGVMYASPGDEVRWMNARENPVRVGFLNRNLLEDHQCQNGIVNLLGEVNDLFTIDPGESISLCPVRAGDLRYNVWFDADNPRGSMSPTMTVKIRGG